jgi:hypothetical protein
MERTTFKNLSEEKKMIRFIATVRAEKGGILQ